MANFYYVKSGGTAGTSTDDGRVATTRSTGSFATKGAANYWDSILDAVTATTPPNVGDFIMCSDAHDKTFTATQTWVIPDGVTVISVADANLDQYAVGAKEIIDNGGTTVDGLFDVADQGECSLFGLTLGSEDVFSFGGTGGKFYMEDCTFQTVNGGAFPILNVGLFADDGMYVFWKNCEVNHSSSGGRITVGAFSTLEIDNLTSTGTKITDLIDSSGNDGAHVIIRNSDLSQILISSGDIVGLAVSTDDMLDVYIENCKLPTSFRLHQPTLPYVNFKLVLSGCGVTDAYHHFEREEVHNFVIQDLTIHLNATYDGTTKFSTKITTQSKISPYYPYRYLLGILTAQDLTTAKTVTVELTGDVSLTDSDIWLEITRQNTTDQALGVVVTTQETDVLAAGTSLATPADPGWTNPENETYQITKDLGVIANVDNSTVQVWACIGKPSISVNFDQPTIADT